LNEIDDKENTAVGDDDDMYAYKRPTWYTSPNKDRTESVIPPHLYGRLRHLIKRGSLRLLLTRRRSFTDDDRNAGVELVDKFGFYKDNDGKYRNIHDDALVLDELPYMKSNSE
jgi:hypothetical protein